MQNSSKFFVNRDCSFFPCHKGLEEGNFNCLFCYCPLYERIPCPGKPDFIKKDDGRIIKRCTDCTFPHRPENYDKIMSLLRTKKAEPVFSEEYHHGGEQINCTAGDGIIDFSVNTNPLGLPESAKSAIKESLAVCEKYPDQNCSELRKKTAEKLRKTFNLSQLKEDRIVFGNGASELIQLAVQAVRPKKALIPAPSFSGYERALKSYGSEILYHNLSAGKEFCLDEGFLEKIENSSPDMVFLCNPNNPTGKMIEPLLMQKTVNLCESKGIFLLIDECFIEFTSRSEESALRLINNCPHIIVLNAFTKIYAMAGLRLGYLVSSNLPLIQKINFLKPEWNVSGISQKAGEAVLDEKDYIEKTGELVKNEREFLTGELKALGFEVFGSDANFILIKNIVKPSEKLDSLLLKRSFSVRNCANFRNLDETYYRLAVKTHTENEKLLSAIKEITLQNPKI